MTEINAIASKALLSEAAEEAKAFKDAAGQNARALIELMRTRAGIAAASASREAREAILREASRHTKKWTAAIQAGAQIDVSDLLRDDDLVDVLSIASERFNAMITRLSGDVLAKIEAETLTGIFEGRGYRQIQKSIMAATGIGAARAKLIARDQVQKLNGAMNQFRQQQAGVTHYKWRTMLDGRERDTHRARNGHIYAWAVPPPGTGHPGHEINCRCRALAVLIDKEDDAAALIAPVNPLDLEANRDLILSVAMTPQTNTTKWTREQLLTRLAEVRQVEEIVKAARASPLVTETQAASVVRTFYGHMPSDDVFAGLAEAKFFGVLTAKRTLLFKAVLARIEMIRNVLEHAADFAEA